MNSEPDFLKPSNKFIVDASVILERYQLLQLHKFLNLHYLGDEDANSIVNGKLVAKYPEKETEEFKNATYNANASHSVKLSVEFDVNGKPTFEIVK
jgi:hypothetical protein